MRRLRFGSCAISVTVEIFEQMSKFMCEQFTWSACASGATQFHRHMKYRTQCRKSCSTAEYVYTERLCIGSYLISGTHSIMDQMSKILCYSRTCLHGAPEHRELCNFGKSPNGWTNVEKYWLFCINVVKYRTLCPNCRWGLYKAPEVWELCNFRNSPNMWTNVENHVRRQNMFTWSAWASGAM